MAEDLTGHRIAFLVANEGVEQVELTEPWQAVEKAGGQPILLAPDPGPVQAFHHLDKGDTYAVDVTVDRTALDDYTGLVLPGGVANPDLLRTRPDAVAWTRKFVESGKPIAAICHGPWTLVEADAVRGRTLTSWPSLRTDLRNAGANWVDQEVCLDENGPGILVTSRNPGDLPAFCDEATRAFIAAT